MVSQIRKRKSAIKETLPEIPKKLYFSIGEVSRLCALKQHVLRYWETRFSQQIKLKKRNGRRYYEKEHILLIRQLKELLYVKGYTIEGARQHLVKMGKVDQEIKPMQSERKREENKAPKNLVSEVVTTLEALVKELEALLVA
jgi:DNA-binding transcriptional MerR regulator